MKREERAQQLWSILVLAARNRQVLTYEIVAQACGVPPPSIGDFLRPIQQYCSEANLPPLTSIIVSKNTGLPGEGFIAENVPLAQIETFAVDWLGYLYQLRRLSSWRIHIAEHRIGDNAQPGA
jgi:hypothetical protein